ncbi:hypothetical protein BC834DRAFT_827717, partial [Gloeopeniophorella convolvens]
QVTCRLEFARSYLLPLHEFCADRSRAPKVLGYDILPGGWHVVVMEYIPHDSQTPQTHTLYSNVAKFKETWSRDLKQLVDEFHEQGWVHGDLRVVNFVVGEDDPEQIMLVDFDWAGDVNAGKVCYPTSQLTDELLDPSDALNLEITRERDKRVLLFALEHM